MLLAERILLLARDLSGEPLNSSQKGRDLARWLGVAVVTELAAMGRLRFSEGKVSATDHMPTQHSLLTDALNLLYRKPNQKVGDAIQLVIDHQPRIIAEMCESMVRRGLLLHTRKRRFGLFPMHRFPVQSTRTYQECLDELKQAARADDFNDLRVLALYLLCDGMGLTASHLSADEARDAHARVAALEDELTGNRQATDPNLQRARLILILTNPFAPEAAA